MSKAGAYAKKGMIWGTVVGAALGACTGLLGGPFAEITVPLGIFLGALNGFIQGGVLGFIFGGLVKDDPQPSIPSELAKAGSRTPVSLEPSLSQQQEQASARFQSQEAARRQAMATEQTR